MQIAAMALFWFCKSDSAWSTATKSSHSRRLFWYGGGRSLQPCSSGMVRGANAQPGKTKPGDRPTIKLGANTSFALLKQIDTGEDRAANRGCVDHPATLSFPASVENSASSLTRPGSIVLE